MNQENEFVVLIKSLFPQLFLFGSSNIKLTLIVLIDMFRDRNVAMQVFVNLKITQES